MLKVSSSAFARLTLQVAWRYPLFEPAADRSFDCDINSGKRRMFDKCQSLVAITMCLVLASCQLTWEDTTFHTETKSSDCVIQCWLGIKPNSSNREDVMQILSDLSIDYEVTSTSFENDTFHWRSDIPILAEGLNDTIVNVSVAFDQNDIVWQIAFVPTNICSQQIISWLGIPPVVLRYEDNTHINLVYPEKGLIFLVNLSVSEDIGTIFIRSEASARSWINQFNKREYSSWDEVESTLIQVCRQPSERIYPFSCFK